MSLAYRVAESVTTHARVVFVVLLLATALVGSGVTMIDDDSSLEGIESDSPESQARDYVEANFTAAEENRTDALLVQTGENVLTRESLLESLRFQQELRENDSVNETLVADEPITGVENVLAMAAIVEEEVDELEDRADELNETADELNETGDRLEEGLDEVRSIYREYAEEAAERGLEEGDPEYQELIEQRDEEVDAVFREVTEGLDEDQQFSYNGSARSAGQYEVQLVEMEQEYGEEEARERAEYVHITDFQLDDIYSWATRVILSKDYQDLQRQSLELENEFEALEDIERRPLEEQIAALERLDDEEYEELVAETLDGEGPRGNDVLRLLASSYEPGSTEADARMTAITQEVEEAGGVEMGVEDERIIESQLAIRELANQQGSENEHDGETERDGETEYRVFGEGLLEEEIDRSMGDSLWIVGPLTLLFVVGALAVAYRDPLDIALGVAGIVAVLVWTFGLLGWSGLSFNVLFVAIPILLIGLSIDFALHVFMRYREEREAERSEASKMRTAETDDPVRGPMTVALAGVGVALVWVTATTTMGFLANAVSPLGMIQEFGVVSAFGILSALVVFGALVPAAKVELDAFLESRGFDRRKRAFGTGGGRVSRALSIGAVAARRAPLVVLLAVLLLTAGGVYGAVQVDTTFEEEDFVAESPPEWTAHLPGPMAPGEYHTKADLDVVNEHFHGGDEAQILVRGNVTGDDALRRLATAQDDAATSDVVYTLPNGEADVRSPLSVMERVADEDDSFNDSFHDADTDGDGVPDEDVEELYDELFETDEEAASEVIYRTNASVESDGSEAAVDEASDEYEAVRLVVAVRGDASYAETTEAMRAIAATLDDGGGVGGTDADDGNGDADDGDADDGNGNGDANDIDGNGSANDGDGGGSADDSAGGGDANDGDGNDTDASAWTAIATGDSVVNHTIEVDLRNTVLEGLMVAFVAVFLFLTIAYWLTGNGATLGAVTLLPVTLSVSWILGTMYLLGIPFNVLTVMITSLTIGLGVDYSIHVSSRYQLELERQGNARDAMYTTVTGTGGALLGSAATTVGAFGTLAFAILPVLRQFGVVTGLTVTYSFLASVIVLPTLLVLWTRYLGPADAFVEPTRAPAAGDGGNEADVQKPGGDE